MSFSPDTLSNIFAPRKHCSRSKNKRSNPTHDLQKKGKRKKSKHEEMVHIQGVPSNVLYNGYTVPASVSRTVLPLNVKNAFSRDKQICFSEPDHKYYIKGKTQGWVSVTKICHMFFSSFDAYRVAKQMCARHDFHINPRYNQYQTLCEEHPNNQKDLVRAVMRSWTVNGRKQSRLGSELHDWVERFVNGLLSESEVSDGIERFPERIYALKYISKRRSEGWVPWRTEVMVFDEESKVCGMVDAIFKDRDGCFRMVDWKRSKKINTHGFDKGWGPCEGLSNCNYQHYTLQLNTYKYILEKHYKIRIMSMELAVFHPNNATFLCIPIENKQDMIHSIMKQRMRG